MNSVLIQLLRTVTVAIIHFVWCSAQQWAPHQSTSTVSKRVQPLMEYTATEGLWIHNPSIPRSWIGSCCVGCVSCTGFFQSAKILFKSEFHAACSGSASSTNAAQSTNSLHTTPRADTPAKCMLGHTDAHATCRASRHIYVLIMLHTAQRWHAFGAVVAVAAKGQTHAHTYAATHVT